MKRLKNKKRYGIVAERELVEFFWKHGGAAIRVAGSGAIRKPSADLIASLNDRYVIEVKKTKNRYIYISSLQIRALLEFANRMKMQPLIAIKFKSKWMICNPLHLDLEKKRVRIKEEDCLDLHQYFLLNY